MTRISELPRISSRGQLTADDLIVLNDGSKTKTIPASILSNRVGAGYSHTGGFAGKPLSNNYVWETGEGVQYSQSDVNSGNFKVLSLDNAVHEAVDNPYWSTPDVSGDSNVGLFNGYALPIGVDSLFDFTFDFDTTYPTINDFASNPSSAGSITSFDIFNSSTGRIKLSDLQFGDQLRVRFDFNVIPQVANTTLEPALWYSNRDSDNKETFSFPLTTNPIFFGQGTPGTTILNRTEISAWIISTEDTAALTLPAIKSNNPVIIQPLGLLVTIIR